MDTESQMRCHAAFRACLTELENLFDVAPNPRITYAWAVGVQFSVLFSEAFGLPGFFRPN